MPTYGLIGYPLSHSFSRGYFTEKFAALGIAASHRYLNFELPSVDQFGEILDEYPDLRGCNVTIPHKRAIVGQLDHLDPVAARIGAVNTVRRAPDGTTTGFNTDYLGFRDDLLRQLRAGGRPSDLAGQHALVLGTGGASLAVREALRELGVTPQYVSRTAGADVLNYGDITPDVLAAHRLIINTTPLGMHPRVETAPELPYGALTPDHFCYDLVYNPAETRFMQLARGAGAGAANGLGMLHLQAEAAWAIWNGE
ncbi:shikimate dehydrogenase family protein [Lewinella sp. IMCC34183]|uniref:shikimate dehydrogenase family protein n=1 Tax=Lewinella sp. IMCC34183 TaxID=2248762 RepID=UPI000E25DDE4|nr:shikimate dehydrogenase [Lewinella sp. IMCC34183]